jgi:hypothetical protein
LAGGAVVLVEMGFILPHSNSGWELQAAGNDLRPLHVMCSHRLNYSQQGKSPGGEIDSKPAGLTAWRAMLRDATTQPLTVSRGRHALFWLGFLGIMYLSVTRAPGTPLTGAGVALRLLVMLAFTAGISYFNLGVLVPRLLARGRYVFYVLALLVSLLLGAYALGLTYHRLLDVGRVSIVAADAPEGWSSNLAARLPGEGADENQRAEDGMPRPSRGRLTSIFFVHLVIWVGASALAHFVSSWLRSRDQEKRQLEAELSALRAQLNPHFLFNSLNNIYALALEKSDHGPRYVLKLAELMRYILHDSQAPAVAIGKELAFVQNYLDLEEIRMAGEATLTLETKGDTDTGEIAPLLLLPLVENAFKHGVNAQPREAVVEIRVQVSSDGSLEITVSNTKPSTETAAPWADPSFAAPGGVGLENLRRRLELLYPRRHALSLEDTGERYTASLKISA